MNAITKTGFGVWRFTQAKCGRCNGTAHPTAEAHGALDPGAPNCWPRRFHCRRCNEDFTVELRFADLVHFTLL